MSAAEREIRFRKARRRSIVRLVFLAAIGAAVLVTAGVMIAQQGPANVAAAVDKPNVGTAASDSKRSARPVVNREALQQALTELSEDITALRKQTASTTEFAARAAQLADALQQAFTDYGKGNYALAESAVIRVQENIARLRDEYVAAYTQFHDQAEAAFAEDNISAAAALNRKSLDINPTFADAQKLSERIAVYEQVMDAYEQARVGKVENDLQKQQRAYAEIVRLDPQRQDAKSALTFIEEQIRESQFATLMGDAVKQLENKNPEAAMTLVRQALSLDPDSNPATTLKVRIEKALETQALSEAERQIRALTQADEWDTVAMLGKTYLKAHPTSIYLQDAVQTAERLTEAKVKLAAYLNSPGRLADDNIRSHAQQTLARFADLRDLSESLALKLDNLATLIEQQNAPVAVTITSDDKTFIRVLGVGIVGEVEQKVIRLKPGRYRFEGRREGYRTTLLDVDVSSAAAPVMVNLVCTERV